MHILQAQGTEGFLVVLKIYMFRHNVLRRKIKSSTIWHILIHAEKPQSQLPGTHALPIPSQSTHLPLFLTFLALKMYRISRVGPIRSDFLVRGSRGSPETLAMARAAADEPRYQASDTPTDCNTCQATPKYQHNVTRKHATPGDQGAETQFDA